MVVLGTGLVRDAEGLWPLRRVASGDARTGTLPLWSGHSWVGISLKPQTESKQATIRFESGERISVAADQRLLVASEDDYEMRFVTELRPGDRVCRSLPSISRLPVSGYAKQQAYWQGVAWAKGKHHKNHIRVSIGGLHEEATERLLASEAVLGARGKRRMKSVPFRFGSEREYFKFELPFVYAFDRLGTVTDGRSFGRLPPGVPLLPERQRQLFAHGVVEAMASSAGSAGSCWDIRLSGERKRGFQDLLRSIGLLSDGGRPERIRLAKWITSLRLPMPSGYPMLKEIESEEEATAHCVEVFYAALRSTRRQPLRFAHRVRAALEQDKPVSTVALRAAFKALEVTPKVPIFDVSIVSSVEVDPWISAAFEVSVPVGDLPFATLDVDGFVTVVMPD